MHTAVYVWQIYQVCCVRECVSYQTPFRVEVAGKLGLIHPLLSIRTLREAEQQVSKVKHQVSYSTTHNFVCSSAVNMQL